MNPLAIMRRIDFRAVAYGLFVLLTGWGSSALLSAEPSTRPAPIELSSEQIVKLVDGLTEIDPKKYRNNLEAVRSALYRAQDPLPLSKLLRDRLNEYKHQPSVSYFAGTRTNEFLAQIAREMFLVKRHAQTNDSGEAGRYLSILSQYREEADAKMILDEIKNRAAHYAALKYNPWQASAHMNGSFGVLVSSILNMENVNWIAEMLSLYEDLDVQRKYVMRARLMLASEPTKQLIKEALTKVPFKTIDSFIQTRHILSCSLDVPRDIQNLLHLIPALELQSVSEHKESVTYHFRMPTDSDGLSPSQSDLVINVTIYPTQEAASHGFETVNQTHTGYFHIREPLKNGALYKHERYGHAWAAQFKQYRLDIHPTAPVDLKKTNAAFDQIYRSLSF